MRVVPVWSPHRDDRLFSLSALQRSVELTLRLPF